MSQHPVPVTEPPVAASPPLLPEPPDILLPPLDWTEDPIAVAEWEAQAQDLHNYYLEGDSQW